MKTALHPDAARMIQESLEATRGVKVTEIVSTHMASSALQGMGMVQVKLTGWAPTLNAYAYHWQEDFCTYGGADSQCDEILRLLQGPNAANVLGEERARELGIAEPVDHRAPDGIDHLLVDRSVVGLLSRDGGDAKGALRSVVSQILDMPGFEGRGDVMDCDEGYASGIRLMPKVRLGDAFYDGGWLQTRQVLPETLLEAAVGRRLGDVAAVPPEIADRIVMIAVNDRKGARLDVAPDFMRIGDM